MTKGWLLITGACACAVVVSSCSVLPPFERDLAKMADQKTCVEIEPSRTVYFGYYPIENVDKELTIESVRLVNSKRLKLTGAYLVPIRGKEPIAVASHDPSTVPGWDWSKAVAAEGQRIDPRSGPLDLVIGVSTPAAAGRARALRIDYRIGPRRYYSEWPRKLRVASEPGGCSDDRPA